MREKVSELMDGELQEREARALIARLREAGELRETWRDYHLIGDAMRDSQPLSAGFAARVMARLGEEPTVLSPARRPSGANARWIGLQVAASVAAIALVGWLALAPAPAPQAPVAQAPQGRAVAQAEAASVPPPAAAADYLLAHQRYSPRNALQGMAPYVRTVADQAAARKP